MSQSEDSGRHLAADHARAALADLRNRAERRRHVTESLPADTPGPVQHLVQELQVHQIELEMQYEELLMAQVEVETSRIQYENLYEFAPVGYCTLTTHGVITQLNLRGSQLLGWPRQHVVGRPLALYVAPHYRQELGNYVEALVRGSHTPLVLSLQLLQTAAAPIQVRLEGLLVAGLSPAEPPTLRLALTDITEQHQARQALELSEKRFRILFERNQDGMLLLRDNRFVDCNDAALQLLGLRTKEDLIGQHAAAYSPEKQPNGRFSVLQANTYWDEALRHGHCRFEWRRLRTNGEEFWEDVLLTTIPDPAGEGPLVHASWRDITVEKLAAERVQASEERLKMALHASETGVWIMDYATGLVHLDARSQHIFGHVFDPQPAAFQVLHDAIHPDDQARVAAALQHSATEHAPFDLEHRIVRPDGSVRYVSAVGKVMPAPQGQVGCLMGVLRDITERRASEEELGYKNRLLEHVLLNMPTVLTQLSLDGTYLSVAGSGLRRLHMEGAALVGQNALTRYPQLASHMKHILNGEQITFLGTIPQPNGPTVYFQNYCFFDQQRQQVICFSIDVTELEEGKQQLRTEKEFSQSLLNTTVDCVVALDQELHITAWNARIAALADHSEAEALGRPYQEVLTDLAADPAVHAHIEQALAGEVSEYLNWKGHSHPITLDLHFVPLYRQAGITGMLLIGRDVTERNALEQEAIRLKLRQQQEVLAAILTTQEEERRRIAEALHNGVGQLLYATRLSLDNLPASEALRASQQRLNEAIRSTRTISFELTPGILEDFGLNTALRELVKRIPAHSLTVDLNLTNLDDPLPRPLEMAVYRITQELLNNVMKHAKAQEVFLHIARAEEQVHISVEDDGVGFDPSLPGMSQGIGLAGIRSRVELLGGTLTIRSRVGSGTAVSLALPISDM